MASTTPVRLPWVTFGAKADPDDFKWELYNVNEDFSQANNLAERYPDKLRELEAIVHPLVRARIAKFLAAAEADGAALAVVDIPLLYETGYPYGLDKVAVTSAPDAVIRERALQREGMTVEKLEAILARQVPQAEKLKRADYILDTSGTIADTRNAVADLVETLSRT